MRTLRSRLAAGFVCFLIATACIPARADHATQPQRTLLFPANEADVAEPLRPFVRKLLDPKQEAVQPAGVRPAGVFARVVTRKYLLDGNERKKGGTLGSRPFVFVALPESLYGRSLLQVFSVIGYSAEEVLTGQIGEEKLAVVFRWDDKIVLHPGRDGELAKDWSRAVYPATWDNVFALVDRMAGDPEWHYVREPNAPAVFAKLQLRSQKEGKFVLGFPDEGKRRIKTATYSALRDTRGSDWEYRQFLERSMSLSEHFTGDGTSQPTMVDRARPAAGFPEFVGPNREIAALPEVAIIGLGALSVGEK